MDDPLVASTNPQYHDRLVIELQVQYMKISSSEHGQNILCTEIVHNMFSPCSAKIRASDKDLPVQAEPDGQWKYILNYQDHHTKVMRVERDVQN